MTLSELTSHYASVAERLGKNTNGLIVARLKREIESLQQQLAAERAKLADITSARTAREFEVANSGCIPKVERILRTVCDYYGMTRTDILSHRRTKKVAHARIITAYLMKELTILSYPQIGQRLGGRDHTTILHAYHKISDGMARYREEVDALKAIIERDTLYRC